MRTMSMNDLINTFLLAGDKFMPVMHLRQPEFAYSACGPFTKNKERIQKLRETEDSRYIHQNELDKACFHHDVTYRDFKDLPRSLLNSFWLKYCVIKQSILLEIQNLMDINADLLQWFIIFLIKGLLLLTKGGTIESEIMSNQQLADQLYKTTIRNFKKRKVYSFLKTRQYLGC